jgi:Inner membrane protein YgaP-like, transmembrane domain
MSLSESFAHTSFARFVNSPAGRIARIVVGFGLIGWGYAQRTAPAGIVLMLVGLIPLAAGMFNLCLISALLGGPIRGSKLARSKTTS